MSQTKAVIFSHVRVKATNLLNAGELNYFYQEWEPFVKSCLLCKNIGLVYIYAYYGVEKYVSMIKEDASEVSIPFGIVEEEERMVNALQMTVDIALDELLRSQETVPFRSTDTPTFIIIGVREFATLLNWFRKRNPQLVREITGLSGFTYDSPKFVEAIIRLARGNNNTQRHPEVIIRIDADVEVNESAIQQIINQAEILQNQIKQTYWWFSGCYIGNFPGDPVNEHAVRMHWAIDPLTWNDPQNFRLLPGAETFLRDMGEIGATQVATDSIPSLAGQNLMAVREMALNRMTPQVISGAGLVASAAAIRRLPPFTNARTMMVWIDDDLKRQLHEAVGDIVPSAVERLSSARFKQDRHAFGITTRDIEWAKAEYFRRLLAGCLLRATIKKNDGKPGPLAEWVRQILNKMRTSFSSSDEAVFKEEIKFAAQSRFDEVMDLWTDNDYGSGILREWAGSLTLTDKDLMCDEIAVECVSYIRLLLLWDQYVYAIQDLSPIQAYWLFARIRS